VSSLLRRGLGLDGVVRGEASRIGADLTEQSQALDEAFAAEEVRRAVAATIQALDGSLARAM
jgi:hypothetical protein